MSALGPAVRIASESLGLIGQVATYIRRMGPWFAQRYVKIDSNSVYCSWESITARLEPEKISQEILFHYSVTNATRFSVVITRCSGRGLVEHREFSSETELEECPITLEQGRRVQLTIKQRLTQDEARKLRQKVNEPSSPVECDFGNVKLTVRGKWPPAQYFNEDVTVDNPRLSNR